jgi:hypothetical protein
MYEIETGDLLAYDEQSRQFEALDKVYAALLKGAAAKARAAS